MPRLARLDAPGVLHHVIGRGIERRKIFWKDKDRSDFIDRLAGVVEIGVTSSCVTKSVSSGKKPDMRDYVNQV